MPSKLILHVGDAVALYGLAADALRLAVSVGFALINGLDDLCHVVAVNIIDIAAESFEFLSKVNVRKNLIGCAIQLKSVDINVDDQVIQLISVSSSDCFPDLAFVAFAIAQDSVYIVGLSISFAGERHAHCAGKTLSEGTGRDVDPGALIHAGMSLKRGTFFTEGSKNALIKESELCKACILNGAYMSFGKDEAVSVFPSGVLGINSHFFEVASRYKISRRE